MPDNADATTRFNGDYLTLRGRLAQVQELLRREEDRVRNAVEALRRAIILYSTPEEISMGAVDAARDDLDEARDAWIRLRDEQNSLKSRLGMTEK